MLIRGNERAFLVVIDVMGHGVGTTIGHGEAFAFASDVHVDLPAVQRLAAAPTG